MTSPFERIKAAWSAADRGSELHRAVESLAAEGTTRQALEDALEALLLEVRAAGADDDTEEVVNGAWDRLTGWCHESHRINTPPTTAELVRLPRWAQVAFAARCARRVLPLFLLRWPDAPAGYATRLVWAVEVGERSAARAGAGDDWAPPAGALTCAAYVCDAVTNAGRDRSRATEVIEATSAAVALFKDRAENILDPHLEEVFLVILSHTIGAIADHLATSHETHPAAVLVAHGAIRRDFDAVALLASSQRWTDDTPVPPSAFGPMWPTGKPVRWPDAPIQETDQTTLSGATVRSIVGRLVQAA
jgi:hypothetical protein